VKVNRTPANKGTIEIDTVVPAAVPEQATIEVTDGTHKRKNSTFAVASRCTDVHSSDIIVCLQRSILL
jgi:hypothetical protein